jgi:hypothetical protein
MLALSVRQPYAELILRGIKTVEYRSRPTKILGQRFYLYASGKWTGKKKATREKAWSLDLSASEAGVPRWMMELAEGLRLFPHELPTGVIVGSAVIEKVTRVDGLYGWHLADVKRLSVTKKPARQPQPVWFRPFAA